MQFPTTNASLHTISNGLTVITQVDRAAPVISAQCWVASGSQHEDKLSGSGLSHLLEHMVFKGTDSFTGAELATRVNAEGGQWNAYTSFDRTVYYIDGPSSSWESFVRILFELVFTQYKKRLGRRMRHSCLHMMCHETLGGWEGPKGKKDS